MIRLGKRGQIPRFLLTIVAVIAIVSILGVASSDWGKKIIFNKLYSSRDLSLIVDAMYLVPGNAIASYESGTSNLDFMFSQNRVSATGGKNDILYGQHWYVDVKENPLSLELDNPDSIYLVKNTDGISASDPLTQRSLELMCQETTPGYAISTQTMVIDPSGNPDTDAGEIKVSEKTWRVANYLYSSYNSNVLNFASQPIITRGLEGSASEEERLSIISQDTGLFIGIAAGSLDDEDEQPVRIQIPAVHNLDKNRYLACLIINNLLGEFSGRITSVPVVPQDSPMLTENSAPNSFSLIITLGNLRAGESNILIEHDKVGLAIRDAIKTFYETEVA